VVTVTGGTGIYTATSGSPGIVAAVNGQDVLIQRVIPSPILTGAQVQVSDGTSTATVIVNTSAPGDGSCPANLQLVATPVGTVNLPDCETTRNLIISGGSGAYNVFSNHTSIIAVLASNTTNVLRISRATLTNASGSLQTVSVFDGTLRLDINVATAGDCVAPAP
jgi:hypothetical protein